MTFVIAENSSNDMYVDASGNIATFSGIDAVVQACKAACQVQLAECVLQQGVGLPNFQLIWVGTPDYALWQSYLENTILAVDGVTGVDSIRLSVADNTLNYSALIETDFGQISIPISGAISAGGVLST